METSRLPNARTVGRPRLSRYGGEGYPASAPSVGVVPGGRSGVVLEENDINTERFVVPV